jgi:hypothetical protein
MTPYVGSGPYCYTNALAMVLGPAAPPLPVIETLTGSPFGVQSVGGVLPLFDPYGWDPEIGLDAAIDLLGLRCERSAGGPPEDALGRLRAACADGPVLVGPVDMDLLTYRTGAAARREAAPAGDADAGGTPPPDAGERPDAAPAPVIDAADHYVVVLAVDGGTALLHDPHGHPYATLPTADLLAAWAADAVAYTDTPYVLRSGFARVADVAVDAALERSLPRAVAWLGGRADLPMPPGSLGGAAAVEHLAAQVRAGLDPAVRVLLGVFGIRVGARRLADAAACLGRVGLAGPASVAAAQARLVGALQYPLVTGDDAALAAGLLRLAPTYAELHAALTAAGVTADPSA